MLARRSLARLATSATMAAAPRRALSGEARAAAFAEARKVLETTGALKPANAPETIRAFRNGDANYALSEFQKLGRDHFVRHRRDRVIQFAEQRGIFADFFPKRADDIDVEVHVATAAGDLIALGAAVPPTATVDPVHVYLQPYHADVKKYTLVLVDADKARPDYEVRSEEILWMVKDIPLNAAAATAPLALPTSADGKAEGTKGTLVLPYLPPHPTKGTGAHRMAVFVFEQPAKTAAGDADAAAGVPHALPATLPRGVSVWELIQAHGLTPRGINVWKAEWDEAVPRIFTEMIGEKEPRYVTRPRIGRKGVDGLVHNKYEIAVVAAECDEILADLEELLARTEPVPAPAQQVVYRPQSSTASTSSRSRAQSQQQWAEQQREPYSQPPPAASAQSYSQPQQQQRAPSQRRSADGYAPAVAPAAWKAPSQQQQQQPSSQARWDEPVVRREKVSGPPRAARSSAPVASWDAPQQQQPYPSQQQWDGGQQRREPAAPASWEAPSRQPQPYSQWDDQQHQRENHDPSVGVRQYQSYRPPRPTCERPASVTSSWGSGQQRPNSTGYYPPRPREQAPPVARAPPPAIAMPRIMDPSDTIMGGGSRNPAGETAMLDEEANRIAQRYFAPNRRS
ncbi:39S ribosomal protein L38, mitochondrial [Blastocladiella emersonii ATCC 22665]|nr:39S ribosomal protein L38, mitochondrial [Blastocladiella emersonii ATCC 22665]